MASVDARAVMQNIGRRVAEIRIQLGMTQAALAERVGVSVKYLQRVEWGHENLTVASLVTLANLLRVAPIDLLKAARLRNAKPGRPPTESKRNAALRRSRTRKTPKR